MRKIFALLAAMSISISFLLAGGEQQVPVFPIDKAKVAELFSPEACDFVVKKSTYTACYDKKKKVSKWVFYTLDGSLVNAVNIKKRPRFYPEFSIPKKYRAYPSDYTRSGYDRGHMRPDAATDWDYAHLITTYSMVNVVPQTPVVNRKMWSKAERYARLAATKLGQVEVLNITVFPPAGEEQKTIGKHRIAVPLGFYKVIARSDGSPIRCFYYKNKEYSYGYAKRDSLRNHLVSCSNITVPIK